MLSLIHILQQDIQNEKVLEEKRRMEQMPKGNIHESLAWGMKKSEMENQQRKKTKSKNREMAVSYTHLDVYKRQVV